MDFDTEDLADALAHEEEMLKICQRNRRHLLKEQARAGGKIDLGLKNQIDWHDEQIRVHKAEVARLRTEGVVDRFSFVEARYRAAVARIWRDSEGFLGIAASSELELLRLELGIPLERSKEIEQDIRRDLAEEAFYTTPNGMGLNIFTKDQWVPVLVRAIRLDRYIITALLLKTLITR